MNKRPIEFRFWCPQASAFVQNYNYCGPVDELFDEKDFDVLIPQQFTGLLDKAGNKVFEGDKLLFKYTVGDFAWEEMSEEERDYEQRLNNKLYTGIVTPDIVAPVNMYIHAPVHDGMGIFPLHYATAGWVVGHIFSEDVSCMNKIHDELKKHGIDPYADNE